MKLLVCAHCSITSRLIFYLSSNPISLGSDVTVRIELGCAMPICLSIQFRILCLVLWYLPSLDQWQCICRLVKTLFCPFYWFLLAQSSWAWICYGWIGYGLVLTLCLSGALCCTNEDVCSNGFQIGKYWAGILQPLRGFKPGSASRYSKELC